MAKLNLDAIPRSNRTGYPAPFADNVQGRWYRPLGFAAGLTDFGVSHVTLESGAWSAQRHWHEGEDEFLVMLAGEAVLVDDEGEHVVRAGDCVAFPKNDGNGHCLQNRIEVECVFVVVGRSSATDCHYPDIDLLYDADGWMCHKDRTSY